MDTSLPQVRLHNSLTRRIDPLEPLEPGRVGIYTCGSTVYKYAHIGNLRTYLFGDLLHRTLEYLGYEVRYVKNITDVGHMRNDDHDSLAAADKVEEAAALEGRTPAEIADFYTAAWLEDEALLNILPADVMPRATDHIVDMISLTERLVANGLAYEVDGTIYYDVSAFDGYGKLSGQKVEETHAGHRVDVEAGKRDPADFALWKRAGEHRRPGVGPVAHEDRVAGLEDAARLLLAVVEDAFRRDRADGGRGPVERPRRPWGCRR